MSGCGILVLNAGSSSIKFALFEVGRQGDPALRRRGQIERIGGTARFRAVDANGDTVEDREAGRIDHARALDLLLDWLEAEGAVGSLIGAGHRVVHGGAKRSAPVRLDAAIMDELDGLRPLAPLHQPHNMAAIRGIAARLPDLPQVACFDTAFHATQPEVARRLALPPEYERKGLQRYGFHGISFDYVVSRYPALIGAPLPARLIIAHLGNGASLCAVRDGRSIATTMGFSTLDGLVMGTRPGLLDPGVLLHLMLAEGLDADALARLLYHGSGLLGLSGESSDMRALLASERPEARAAVELFCYRAMREIGSLAAALGGLDALVFTGGIGENAAPVRARIAEGAAWLGLAFDAAANEAGGPHLSRPESRVACWVVPTDEELMIARSTLGLVLNPARPAACRE